MKDTCPLHPPRTPAALRFFNEKGRCLECALQTKMLALADQKGLTKKYPGGHVRIKAVRCGKASCKSCPHQRYAYWRVGKDAEMYVGVVE